MRLIFAIFSADWPIVSPVEGSAIAGVIGTKSRGRIEPRILSRFAALLARDSATSFSDIDRECRIGTFDNDSAPPAIMTSWWPRTIWSAASVMAWLADAQARLTVYASQPRGRIGSSDTSRAMLGAITECTT